MTRVLWIACIAALLFTSCSRKAPQKATANQAAVKPSGPALTIASGDKQSTGVGSPLDQPLIVEADDAQGNPIAGATVKFAGNGVSFNPPSGVTGSDGQFTTSLTLGSEAGRYNVSAVAHDAKGVELEVKTDEIALGYREMLGRQLERYYCSRCHDPESTAARVSNHDNLKASPHLLSDGATLNSLSDADLTAIVTHGGQALHRSAEMPPYGNTLTKNEIGAIIAYARSVANPPYPSK